MIAERFSWEKKLSLDNISLESSVVKKNKENLVICRFEENKWIETKHQHKIFRTSDLMSASMKTDSPNCVEGTDSARGQSQGIIKWGDVPPSPASLQIQYHHVKLLLASGSF